MLNKDCYYHILSFTTGRAIAHCLQTCWLFNGILSAPEFESLIDKHMNHLLKLISLFPNKPWNIKYIQMNPNITREIFERYHSDNIGAIFIDEQGNLQLNLKGPYLLKNPHVNNIKSMRIYDPRGNWFADHKSISTDLWNMSGEELVELIRDPIISQIVKWNMCVLCRHKNITLELMEQNPDINWAMCCLCINRNVSCYDVINNKEVIIGRRKIKLGTNNYASMNPNITWRIVKNNQDYKWDWGQLSKNLFNRYDQYYNISYLRLNYYL